MTGLASIALCRQTTDWYKANMEMARSNTELTEANTDMVKINNEMNKEKQMKYET